MFFKETLKGRYIYVRENGLLVVRTLDTMLKDFGFGPGRTSAGKRLVQYTSTVKKTKRHGSSNSVNNNQ